MSLLSGVGISKLPKVNRWGARRRYSFDDAVHRSDPNRKKQRCPVQSSAIGEFSQRSLKPALVRWFESPTQALMPRRNEHHDSLSASSLEQRTRSPRRAVSKPEYWYD